MAIDVTNSVVKIALDSSGTAGTYVTIKDIRSYTFSHGAGSSAKVFVFSKVGPYVKKGDSTDSYTLTGLLDLTSGDGQNLIAAAYASGDTVWLEVLHDGTTGESQPCVVTQYSGGSDRSGDYVSVAFTLEGNGAITPITGA